MADPTDTHEALMQALMRPEIWPDQAPQLQRIDTLISTVILAGRHAYKFKKPVNLGFVDFSTLAKRRHYCAEEVRLDSRLAPRLYEGVVAVEGGMAQPRFSAHPTGAVLDWAVQMRRFDPGAVLVQAPGVLSRGLMEKLAARLANFHAQAAVCSADEPYGAPDAVISPMEQNFSQIRSQRGSDRALLDRLMDWTEQHFDDNYPRLLARKQQGFIRECHGDLHLGNIVMFDGDPMIFDGIEFNPGLRWIDVLSDVGFLTMDLTRLGRSDLAHWFLDAYLAHTGDYTGLPLLRLYEVYRALVRAKVDAIRSTQRDLSSAHRIRIVAEYRRYLRVAEAFTRPGMRGLVITRGVSASGKSTLTGEILSRLPAVRVRSDVERKRLAGLDPLAPALSRYGTGIYSPHMTERTYGRLAEVAGQILDAGLIAIVDATFLTRELRQRFAALAASYDVPFVILNCELPEAELRERLLSRQQAGFGPSDAGLDVLHAQLQRAEPLGEEEHPYELRVDSRHPLEFDDLIERLQAGTAS